MATTELSINGVPGKPHSFSPKDESTGTEQIYGGGAGVAFVLSDGEVIDIDFNITEGWW